MRRTLALLLSAGLLAPACTTPAAVEPAPLPRERDETPTLQPQPRFEPDRVLDVVRTLAGDLGPREATTDAYARAASFVAGRLEALGYRVRRQRLEVPAGVSWGVPVSAGGTHNVVAEPASFDPRAPWLVVGAHLDTVPRSPGANDNASGVGVMLELARLASEVPLDVQVVFVAFGAEEPRGGGDDDHHYGSRAFVRRLDETAASTLAGGVSLDRVGIGDLVRVCTGGLGPRSLARRFLARATASGIAAAPCENRTSDHWSFERGGFAGVRLLGEDDPAYHTPRDLSGVVERAQVARIGRLAWETLAALRA